MAENENKNNDKKNKDDRDPYNFFKLSGDSNDDNSGKGKGPKFPFLGLMVAVVCVLAFVNIFLMRKPDEMIDFSTFEQLVEDGKIVKVEINLN